MAHTPTVRKDHTRVDILNAAYRLFLENGFHGTSMRSIAHEAGISLGGIYNHFSSKEDIFASIFYEFHPYRELMNQLNQAQGETLEQLLRDGAHRFNDAIFQKPDDFLKLLFIELIEFKAQHVENFFDQFYFKLEQLAARIFSDQHNLFPYPPFVLLRAYLGLIFSYLMTEWMFGKFFPDKGSVGDLDTFVTIYLHGILSEDSEGASKC